MLDRMYCWYFSRIKHDICNENIRWLLPLNKEVFCSSSLLVNQVQCWIYFWIFGDFKFVFLLNFLLLCIYGLENRLGSLAWLLDKGILQVPEEKSWLNRLADNFYLLFFLYCLYVCFCLFFLSFVLNLKKKRQKDIEREKSVNQ